MQQGEKLRGADKLARIPLRDDLAAETARKPDWIRVRIPASPQISRIKRILRRQKLATVCEEASCPNLGECFSHGTATFLIMGDICTRRCPFCDVAHGRPNPLDAEEPVQLAAAIAEMKLNYVVVTSVDRDDRLTLLLNTSGVQPCCPYQSIPILVDHQRSTRRGGA